MNLCLKDRYSLKELVVENEAHWHRGFQYGQISIFKVDLKTYDQHPEHQSLVRKIGPKLAGGNAMDFIPLITDFGDKRNRICLIG